MLGARGRALDIGQSLGCGAGRSSPSSTFPIAPLVWFSNPATARARLRMDMSLRVGAVRYCDPHARGSVDSSATGLSGRLHKASQGWEMDASIRLEGGSPEDIIDLTDWLGGENELRGRCHITPAPIGASELGSVSEVLTVALGSGGAGSVLASSLITWIRTRKTKAKIIIETEEGSISLDIETVRDIAPLLEQTLRMSGDNRA